jgi:drug/metabolite transporter (DMT)-like permease
LSARHLFGVALGLSGSLLLLAQGSKFSADALVGYACAVSASLTWALYSVFARRLRAVPTQAVIGFCAVSAVLAALAHSIFEPTVVPTRTIFGTVLLLGMGPVGIAFLLWDVGMKQGDPRLLGTLAYATPVASTMILGLAGFATVSLITMVAALLVAAGGWLAARARQSPDAV